MSMKHIIFGKHTKGFCLKTRPKMRDALDLRNREKKPI